MKKFLCLFSALSMMLIASCSSDNSSSDSGIDTTIKPTKIIHLTSDNSPIYTREVKYVGNKIVSEIDDDGFEIKYTYTGNLITRVEVFQSPTVLKNTIEYTYVNGKVSAEILRWPNVTSYSETKYTHNTDSTISYEERQINPTLDDIVLASGKHTYKNGNLIKTERKDNEENIKTVLYEYDTKKNPRRNILGINLIMYSVSDSSFNNLVKWTDSSFGESTFSYLYDNNGFPTEHKHYINGVIYEIVQYFY
ncbi:DUF5004 domain-containing protein [Flavobacterium sp. LC2016-12]|uniref:DUF5004 domain-containing protein n=1 Tax=Flavobacterium sp. LC2016-12 TaxID=2783794 RepID=UPI00188ADADC|nr:DUF5004 domain-containing protein [Flavobacterium sp. LC2016-12]MBF4466789.1 hypothetical protein [Flavobacterium sp. LC2016-12]